MTVRPARATDLYLLYGLSATEDPPFVRDVARFLAINAWERQHERDDSNLVILELSGDTIGAASFQRAEPRVWLIAAICLFPEHRGSGHGAIAISEICELIERIDPDAESVFWQHHVDNAPMRQLGAKLRATELGVADGFVTVGLPLHV